MTREGDHPVGEVFEKTETTRSAGFGSHSRLGRINVRTKFWQHLPGFPCNERGRPPARRGFRGAASFVTATGSFCALNRAPLSAGPSRVFRGTVVIRDSTESQVRDTDKPARPSGAPDPSWVLRNGSHSATRPNLWCTTINRPPPWAPGPSRVFGRRQSFATRPNLCARRKTGPPISGAGPFEGFRFGVFRDCDRIFSAQS